MRIRVKVPASSANLGCGFDVFGLALALYSDFIFDPAHPSAATYPLTVTGDGATSLQAEKCGLVYEAVRVYETATGYKVPPFALEVHNRIPLGRGLGSSASAIVGGLVGADALCRQAYGGEAFPTTSQLVQLATKIEGHPDNVAPALLGGLILAVGEATDTNDDENLGHPFALKDPANWPDPLLVSLPLPFDLTTVVYIPDFEMSTKAARAVIPASFSLHDAVHNSARTALLVAALTAPTGKLEWLATAMDDRIHQPYRAQIFPQLPTLIAAAQEAGAYGAALSGAGSTVLSFASPQHIEAIRTAFLHVASEANLPGRVEQLEIATDGPAVSFED